MIAGSKCPLEYFADGISEDIITALSKLSQLFVIARNSSFTFKGRNVNVQVVGRGLGVRYVLEGSVRKSGSRVRITAQLIDATSGGHLWAERFDRDLQRGRRQRLLSGGGRAHVNGQHPGRRA